MADTSHIETENDKKKNDVIPVVLFIYVIISIILMFVAYKNS